MLKSLCDYISRIPNDRVYIKNQSLSISYGELSKKIDFFSTKYEEIKGQRCAIICDTRESLALYLPCIENIASGIFLQPNGLSTVDVTNLYISGVISFVISIDNDEIKIKKINVRPAVQDDCEWLLATSGTTGTPKLLSYNLHTLVSTCKTDISKGAGYCWGLVYDLNRFAGLQVYFQAISSGSCFVLAEADDSISSLIQLFSDHGVNALSATPSFWRKLLMSDKSELMLLERITLGGEIAEQAILDSLKFKYPLAKIHHIYASTEAGVGFAVKDGIMGFPLSDMNSEQLKMKIVEGNLWIKSNRGAKSILSGNLNIDEFGYMDTGDEVKVVDERVIFIGRSSGAINVGGNKVMPEEIEKVLNSYEHIAQSRVAAKQNSLLGSLVVAEVRLEHDIALDKKVMKTKILEFCRAHLDDYKIPALIKFVTNIPVNDTGKIIRKSK